MVCLQGIKGSWMWKLVVGIPGWSPEFLLIENWVVWFQYCSRMIYIYILNKCTDSIFGYEGEALGNQRYRLVSKHWFDWASASYLLIYMVLWFVLMILCFTIFAANMCKYCSCFCKVISKRLIWMWYHTQIAVKVLWDWYNQSSSWYKQMDVKMMSDWYMNLI